MESNTARKLELKACAVGWAHLRWSRQLEEIFLFAFEKKLKIDKFGFRWINSRSVNYRQCSFDQSGELSQKASAKQAILV